jgi:hypothetical protein
MLSTDWMVVKGICLVVETDSESPQTNVMPEKQIMSVNQRYADGVHSCAAFAALRRRMVNNNGDRWMVDGGWTRVVG